MALKLWAALPSWPLDVSFERLRDVRSALSRQSVAFLTAAMFAALGTSSVFAQGVAAAAEAGSARAMQATRAGERSVAIRAMPW